MKNRPRSKLIGFPGPGCNARIFPRWIFARLDRGVSDVSASLIADHPDPFRRLTQGVCNRRCNPTVCNTASSRFASDRSDAGISRRFNGSRRFAHTPFAISTVYWKKRGKKKIRIRRVVPRRARSGSLVLARDSRSLSDNPGAAEPVTSTDLRRR